MPEEQIPTSTPESTKPKIRTEIKPLSIVDFAPFSVLIFNRTIFIPTSDGHEEVKHEVMLQLRRAQRDINDDPGSIPLTAIPSLAMLLGEIAKSSMELTAVPTKAPPPPAPAKKQVRRKK